MAPATVEGKTRPHRGRVAALLKDPEWAGKPFWMLNIVMLKGGHDPKGEGKYAEYLRAQAEHEKDRRLVMKGYARTVIGATDYHLVTIVEYPSPAAFVAMGQTDAYAQRNAKLRLEGLVEQYLIPIRPGFRLSPPPRPAARPFTAFTPESVWATPSGLVGAGAEGARVGETSSTRAQAEGFVRDPVITAGSAAVPGSGSPHAVWHLNLLRHKDRGQEYSKYATAMGGRDGILSEFGARVTMSSQCFPSLMGDVDFHRAAIAEYPCRDSYLTMGTDPRYIDASRHRHAGLEATYIISIVPDFVEERPPPAKL